MEIPKAPQHLQPELCRFHFLLFVIDFYLDLDIPCLKKKNPSNLKNTSLRAKSRREPSFIALALRQVSNGSQIWGEDFAQSTWSLCFSRIFSFWEVWKSALWLPIWEALSASHYLKESMVIVASCDGYLVSDSWGWKEPWKWFQVQHPRDAGQVA